MSFENTNQTHKVTKVASEGITCITSKTWLSSTNILVQKWLLLTSEYGRLVEFRHMRIEKKNYLGASRLEINRIIRISELVEFKYKYET